MERRVFVAILLSFLVLFGFQMLFPPPEPVPPAQPVAQGPAGRGRPLRSSAGGGRAGRGRHHQ